MFEDQLLGRFEGVSKSGDGWSARCPAHDDHNPSLSINRGSDGHVLIHCHGGCSPQDIVRAVDLNMSDLFTDAGSVNNLPPPTTQDAANPKFIPDDEVKRFQTQLTADDREYLRTVRMLTNDVIDRYEIGSDKGRVTIPIRDAFGRCLDIRCWLRPDRRDVASSSPKIKSFGKGLGAARPYPTENLHNKHLVLCEGELDALALISQGIPAITVTGGAGAASGPLAAELKSAGVEQVTLAMDHDLAGIQGADKYRDSLEKQGIGVKTIMWPSEREKSWDITDELANNGIESLRLIFDTASQSIGPAQGPFKLLTMADVLKHAVEIEWQVDQVMAKGSVMLLAGEPSVGKTWLLFDLALAIAQGRPWLNRFEVMPGRVLIIDEENRLPLIKHRMQNLAKAEETLADPDKLEISWMVQQGLNLSTPAHVTLLTQIIKQTQADLVVIDSLIRIHTANENDAGEMARVFKSVSQIIDQTGTSVVFSHHHRKSSSNGGSSSSRARGSSEIRAFVDTHLDIRAKGAQPGVCYVEHSKSRYAEPVESFYAQIIDLGPKAISVSALESDSPSDVKVNLSIDWIMQHINDDEWHSRESIITAGGEIGHKRDNLDRAIKALVADGKIAQRKHERKHQFKINR